MRHGWVYLYESPPRSDTFRGAGRSASAQRYLSGRPRHRQGDKTVNHRRADLVFERGHYWRACECHRGQFQSLLRSVRQRILLNRKLNDETLREGYSLDGKTEEESQHIIE